LKQLVESRYLLGRLAQEAGRRDESIEHYNEVISMDYGYKDARERLEKLQGDQGQDTGLVDDI
jgi:hypothetical protein